MKIRVERSNGDIETLTLVPPFELKDGDAMWHIHSADGMDHYFLTSTGHYDGWGKAAEGLSDEEALQEIERVESSREIESKRNS